MINYALLYKVRNIDIYFCSNLLIERGLSPQKSNFPGVIKVTDVTSEALFINKIILYYLSKSYYFITKMYMHNKITYIKLTVNQCIHKLLVVINIQI